MNIEERLERIEHLAAGTAEERRKDREEYKNLWRDTQRQIDETATNVNRLSLAIAGTNEQLHHLTDRVERLAEESRAADKRLEDRIASLVPAIGQFIAGQRP